jgi:hypothetical protein
MLSLRMLGDVFCNTYQSMLMLIAVEKSRTMYDAGIESRQGKYSQSSNDKQTAKEVLQHVRQAR